MEAAPAKAGCFVFVAAAIVAHISWIPLATPAITIGELTIFGTVSLSA